MTDAGKARRHQHAGGLRHLTCAALVALVPIAALGAGSDSPRLSRAKDLIADEQWRRAVVELRAAYEDPAEAARDEAAFWLAHSLYQSGDAGGALQTIAQLERQFPRSRWVFPARSLKVEIAHRLNRSDMLWSYATPPPPPAASAPRAAVATVAPARPAAPPAAPVGVTPPAEPLPPPPPGAAPPAPVRRLTTRPRREWVSADPVDDPSAFAERDLRILALGSLIRAQPARAVPMLKEIALSTTDEEQARRAIFVLMQSDRREARMAVADLAKKGPEEVTLAAVKELGLVRSFETGRLLRELYDDGTRTVKAQVLRSLGTARQAQPLMQIARFESERGLRETAVVALGQAGARTQLATLYRHHPDLREPVITALFTAAGEDELIDIVRAERDPRLRAEAVSRLKLLGTPRALAAVERLR